MLEIISTLAAVVSAVFQWLEYRYARNSNTQSAPLPQAVSRGIAQRKASTVAKRLLQKQDLFMRWLIASTLVSAGILIALVLWGLGGLSYSYLFDEFLIPVALIVTVLGACVCGVSIALGYVAYIVSRDLRYYSLDDGALFYLKQEIDQKHWKSVITKRLVQQALVEATENPKNSGHDVIKHR